MRRVILALLAAAMLASSGGCIAANVKNNRIGADKSVVAVQDRVYVVDTKTGCVQEIDMSNARPFVPCHDEDED